MILLKIKTLFNLIIIFTLVLLTTVTPYRLLHSSVFRKPQQFIDGNKLCQIAHSDQLKCVDTQTMKNSEYTIKNYEHKFGMPFQFVSHEGRKVQVKGLVWKQKNFEWSIGDDTQNKLVLSDYKFHSLYSVAEYFKDKKTTLRNYALCKAETQGDGFNCNMPWGEYQKVSDDQFNQIFLGKRKPEEGESQRCFKDEVFSFWNSDHTLWRCWNGFFWPSINPRLEVYTPLQFSDKYGKSTQMFSKQPAADVNSCKFDAGKFEKTNFSVWRCNLKTFKRYKNFYLPRYLKENDIYKRNKLIISRQLVAKRYFHTIKYVDETGKSVKTNHFLALLIKNGETRYLTLPQFSAIFQIKLTDMKKKDNIYVFNSGGVANGSESPSRQQSAPFNNKITKTASKDKDTPRIQFVFRGLKVELFNEEYEILSPERYKTDSTMTKDEFLNKYAAMKVPGLSSNFGQFVPSIIF